MPRIPWYGKIAAKLVLARVPLGYHVWRRLHIFRHGLMESPEYALTTFRHHFDRAPFARKDGRCVVLEIGPGDTLFSAISGSALGAQRTYLVDVKRYATVDVAPYQRMAAYLATQGFRPPDLTEALSLDDVLSTCRAEYLTAGIESLRSIPSGSVDLVWSQAVLEHIRLRDFPALASELRRILRPDGAGSHRVDLGDHLGGALNNLRFPRRLWESALMANSGFYTNRIRYTEMVRLFESTGFAVETIAIDRWDKLPTRREHLSPEFRQWTDEELTVRGFDLILRPR